MSDVRKIVAATGVVAAAAFAWYVKGRRTLKKGFLASRIPPQGQVAIYGVTNIERDEKIMIHGVNTFTAVDTGRQNDISFAELLATNDTVLYTYDLKQNILVFLTVTDKAALWREPFLDRGVRKLAASRAYVCSVETAQKFWETHKSQLPDSSRDTFLTVWNTGRCGSTLFARLTSATSATVTLSEPDWVDQLLSDKAVLEREPDRYHQLVRLLHVFDFHLARTLLPADHVGGKIVYSLNPKGSHAFLRDPVVRVFPETKHVFMYRDMLKVVESFGSIFSSRPLLTTLKMAVYKIVGGGPAGPGRGKPVPLSSVMKNLSDSLPKPSNFIVRMLSSMWLDSMLSWMEWTAAGGKDFPTLTLRMDEFVTKDLVKREAVVRQCLNFAGIHDDAGIMEKAMAVFGVHSQAGTAMERSSAKTGKAFLTESDRSELVALCAAVPQIEKPSFIVPGSLGVEDVPKRA